MISSKDCLKKYGEPSDKSPWMVVWNVPAELQVGNIPRKIYCNIDMIHPLSLAFRFLIDREFVHELHTFDGCFNIRKKRGNNPSYSLHSWGVAIDFNAFDNPFNTTYQQARAKGLVPFSEGFLQCFRDAGMDCGGDWKQPCDRMHFQIQKL
ncbi:MAG: M15 family metallopeptidase [Chitinophagaceae bacterium]|nr:M15 family metallopeptidase [Chitinophagaceae bacterium]